MFNTILNTSLLIPSTKAPVAPVLSVATLKRSSVGQEAINLFWKSVKSQTSQGALQLIIDQIFENRNKAYVQISVSFLCNEITENAFQ